MTREELRHLLRRFQMAFAVREAQGTEVRDRGVIAYCGQDIVQRPARGSVIEDLIGRDQGEPPLPRLLGGVVEVSVVRRAKMDSGGEVGAIAEDIAVFS